MYAASHNVFRIATLVLATVVGLQCIWLLLAELSRPGSHRLATNPAMASNESKGRNDAIWAAWIGAVRGELWAESAFTYADLLWDTTDPQEAEAPERAREQLDKALGYAPHQTDAWLLLAGLESRYRPSKSNPAEALKMSYYTGPSERPLIPLRLLIAARLDALEDIEVQQFIRRDLRYLLALRQTSAVAEAYASASPAGKRFLEQAVDDIDPAYRAALPGMPKPPAK
jgi:hypothetical protein